MEITCPRCNGSGRHSFNLTHGNTCFGCWGKGVVSRTPTQLKQAERNAVRTAKRQEARQAEREARAARVDTLRTRLMALYAGDPRLASVPAEHAPCVVLDIFQYDLSRRGIRVRDLLELEPYLPEEKETR